MLDIEGLIAQTEGMPWRERRTWIASVVTGSGMTREEMMALPDDLKMRLAMATSRQCGLSWSEPSPEEIREEIRGLAGDIVLTVVSLLALIGVVVWVVAEAFR